MASLRIRHPQGHVDYIPIVANETISIGSHSSNDILIDDDGVDMLHCRILLSKKGLEAHAGGMLPLIFNQEEVRSATLREGDLLKIGNTYFDVAEIKPEELSLFAPTSNEDSDKPSRNEAEKSAKPAKKIANIEDLLEDESEASSEPDSGKLIERNVSEDFKVKNDDKGRRASARDLLKEKAKLRKNAKRPGEEEVLKSPLILSLAGISALLLVAGMVYAFMFTKNLAQQQYEAAIAERDGGRHTQAIQLFDDFVAKYASHSLIPEVLIKRSASYVDLEIAGGTPNWEKGLEQLDKFIEEQRDRPKFSELSTEFSQYAEKIALGAAKSAGDRLNANLLDITEKAKALMERFTPKDAPKTETIREIDKLMGLSKAIILKNDVLVQALAEIDGLTKENKPIAGLQRRRELLARYPDFKTSPKVKQRFEELLRIERQNVSLEDLNQPAIKPEQLTNDLTKQTYSICIRSRTRSDRQNSGDYVIVIAKDACYAIDINTGEPAWQYTIGLNPPFIPFLVNASYEGCLLFDQNHSEMVMLNAQTGAVIWKKVLDENLSAIPVVHQGQIFAAGVAGGLFLLDAEAGTLLKKLKFSQPFVGTPLLSRDGEQLYLAGEQEIIYRLKVRPLSCDGIYAFGHAAGSINNPLIALGKFILCSQIQPDNSTKLTILETTPDDKICTILQEEKLEGVIQDEILLRGNQVFIPTRPERVIVYSVTDEPGKTPLTRIASYEQKEPVDRPIYLSTGPDGKVWMASRSVQELQLTKDGFIRGEESLVDSRITQPLQNLQNKLFISRKLDACNATFLSEADRESLSSSWQTVIGAEIKSLTPIAAANQGGQKRVICVTEAGAVIRLDLNDKPQSFIITALTEVATTDLLVTPFIITPTNNGYTLITSSDKKNARGWVINPAGQVEQAVTYPELATGPSILMSSRMLIPLKGKLHLAKRNRTDAEYDDFVVPTSEINNSQWTTLIPLDQTLFLAINDQGVLRKLQLRNAPSKHIGEVSQQKLTPGTRMTYWPGLDVIVTVGLDGKVEFLRASTLERLQSYDPPGTYIAGPFVLGELLLIQFKDQLVAWNAVNQREPSWKVNLPNTPLVANPLIKDGMLSCISEAGDILQIDVKTGEIKHQTSINQPVTSPPLMSYDKIFLGTVSGNVIVIPADNPAK